MLDRLTYKQKNIGLLILIAVFGVLAYNLSISKTLHQYGRLKNDRVKLSRMESAPQQIAVKQQELSELNAVVGELGNDFEVFQEELLSAVVMYGGDYKVKLISVNEPHSYIRNGVEVQTAILRLRGRFNGITKLLNQLEKDKGKGRVTSCNYKLVEDKRLKRHFLEAEIHVQNFKKL